MLSREALMVKKMLIAGIQGSGKTVLARYIARRFPRDTAVYTPHLEEWANEAVYLFKPRDFIADFPLWLRAFKQMKLRLLVVDEADLLFRHHFDTSPELRDLVINHRHFTPPRSLVFVTRRPQDIPPRITNTFEFIACFYLDAPQTYDMLERWAAGFGDAVRSLGYGSHDFILKYPGGLKRCRVRWEE